MLNISSKTKSHILVLIFGPHVPLWLPSIVTLHVYRWQPYSRAILNRFHIAVEYNVCLANSLFSAGTREEHPIIIPPYLEKLSGSK